MKFARITLSLLFAGAISFAFLASAPAAEKEAPKAQPKEVKRSDRVAATKPSTKPTTAPTTKPVRQAGPPTDEERKPHSKPKDGETYALEIKELGNFQFDQEKGGNIPKDVQALTGSKIRLTGFMIPLDQADKIKQFVLVPDLFSCCFGQAPQVQHSVIVACPEGKAVSYFPDQIQVEGKLNVEEKKDDGFIISIFQLTCTSVKPTVK